jgi:ATP-binding cassette subfamily B protein
MNRMASPGAGAPASAERVPLVSASTRRHREAVGFDAATLRRVTAMAFRHRAAMALALAATALAAAAQVAIPRLIGEAVDHATGLLAGSAAGESAARAARADAAWLLLAAALFRGASTMVQNYLGESVGHRIAYELRVAFYAKLQRLSFRYHDRTHTGELMTRGILDIEGVRMWVHTGVLRLVLLAVLIGGGAAMLIAIDGGLALVALAFVPVVGAGASIARLKLRALWYALQEELGVLTRIMEENLGGIRVVRAYAAQAFEMTRFDAISSRALAILHRRIAVFVASTTSMTFVFFLAMGLVLWVGGEYVLEGRITVGELTTFLAFMTILQAPVRQIAWMVNSIARTSTCGQRLFEILDLEPDIRDRADALPLRAGAGTLRFEHVSFGYEAGQGGDAPATLSDVSFELRRGRVLGLVGPPGSGKSTIAHLIPRFYDVTAGRITIDGQDVRDVTLESLRGFVSIVQQDAYLFTAPVETNVAYGDPWADRSAIRRASESAQLHQYIAQLPEGYETLVGERGVSLSGGQRQRLAIARAVLPESGLLVFDDSTAAVDVATERAIRAALAGYMRERATIIIAHRLASLMHADEILYLEAGRVAERGSHDELVALGGRYAALHALQTRSPDAAP